jgi:hypothetical protein
VSVKICAVLAIALLAACAAQPPQPVSAAAPPLQPVSAAAPPPTHAKAMSGALLAVPPEQRAAVNKDLVKRGYLARLYRGEIVYCREEAVTGSLFTSLNCQSEEHLQRLEENAAREMRQTGGSSCGHAGQPSC